MANDLRPLPGLFGEWFPAAHHIFLPLFLCLSALYHASPRRWRTSVQQEPIWILINFFLTPSCPGSGVVWNSTAEGPGY